VIEDLWRELARQGARDEVDALRKVLDPSDKGGAKNLYLDSYLKHYLLEHLDAKSSDVVLEIGCGTGRLTECVAPRVAEIYGTDLIDDFVRQCRSAPRKAINSHYLLQAELSALKTVPVNKLYIVWVLMYLEDDDAAVEVLRSYLALLPPQFSAVVIEQVKASAENQENARGFYCRYRTVEGYARLFEKAGLRVTRRVLLPERRIGTLYRGLRLGYRLLPRAAARLGTFLFAADHALQVRLGEPERLQPSQRTPTDAAFELRRL
jgi:ubiquinone/menaquinone biosynthesis C-methylase UbiE